MAHMGFRVSVTTVGAFVPGYFGEYLTNLNAEDAALRTHPKP